MKDFFISYNKADRARAEWIASQFDEGGYTVFLQAWDIRPGSNFVLEMQRAASEAERTIAVLSPDYLSASFTLPELAAAFAQDPTGEKGKLVPVRVRECEIRGLWRPIVYIDLVNKDEAAAKRALLEGVKRGRITPDESPGISRFDFANDRDRVAWRRDAFDLECSSSSQSELHRTRRRTRRT